MTLSLDTNVLIDVMRGRSLLVRQRFGKAQNDGELIVVSAIVYHELFYGAMLSGRAEPHLALAKLLADIAIEPLTEDDVTTAAMVRADLKQKGRPIGPYDALIAGQALARGWAVVTGNVGEFERVADLKVINWAKPAEDAIGAP